MCGHRITIYASHLVLKSSGHEINVNLVLDWGYTWSSQQKQIEDHCLGTLS